MSQRQVFGKKRRAKQDAFAAMLYSSPELHTTNGASEQDSDAKRPEQINITELRLSPRRKTATALRPINGNAGPRRTSANESPRPGKLGLIAVSKHEEIEQGVQRSSITRNPRSQVQTLRSLDDTELQKSSSCHERDACAERFIRRPRKAVSKTVKSCDTSTPVPVLEDSLVRLQQEDDVYHGHCESLLKLQNGTIESFQTWSEELDDHLSVDKIAEASYGEVYRLALRISGDDSELSVAKCGQSVLKMIALRPPEELLPTRKRERDRILNKTASMSRPEDVATEVRLLQRMSSIPGFINFRDVRVLKGQPGQPFVKAYEAYNKAQKAAKKDLSIFPDPSKKLSYASDQLWAVIEMQDAGTDLERLIERGRCRSIYHIWDIFWQTTLALAKGEEGAEFEHRDLHLGNICIEGDDGRDLRPRDPQRKLGFTDTSVTLIDYTISRAAMRQNANGSDDVAYLDLSQDQHIFEGDSTNEYQYEIYRYMRSALYFDDASSELDDRELLEDRMQASGRSWQQFRPQTNLIWLHFVLRTLLATAQSVCQSRDCVNPWIEKEEELTGILREIDTLLAPKLVIKNGFRSAGDLVAMAVAEGWLDPQDIIGPDPSLLDLDRSLAALSIVA